MRWQEFQGSFTAAAAQELILESSIPWLLCEDGSRPGSHAELPPASAHTRLSCFSLTAECLTRVTARKLENVCRSLRQTYPDLCPLKQWEASELSVCASHVDEAPHAAPSPSPGLGPSQEWDLPPWSRGVFGCHEGAGGAVCAHSFVHVSVRGDVCACGCSEIM